MRYFNTEGICRPDKHYMVRLDERLRKIKDDYVERGSYFIINRGRQYGKTTTLRALAEYLRSDYLTIFMDFQKMSTAVYENEYKFTAAFAKYFVEGLGRFASGIDSGIMEQLAGVTSKTEHDMGELFDLLSRLCAASAQPVVLLIDEVDSASNNQVFLDFLALLRGYYLDRDNKPIFQSVILAGVYDIKNLKSKIRPDAEHQYNSPWNIAARFNVNMSFSAAQIAAMLREYEDDHHTGMDIEEVAGYLYDYTSGYPYLVSALCKLLDEDVPAREGFADQTMVWSRNGIEEAVKLLENISSPIFGSMVRQLYEHEEMKQLLYAILFQGKQVSCNADNQVIDKALMFGYIAEQNKGIQVSNRIFEMRLYNLFLSEEEICNAIYGAAQADKSQFVRENRLDMDRVLEKFVVYFTDIYGNNDERFLEEQGRKLFLLYLKPIINGTGNYYIEARTRDARRTDVVVDFLGEQFVIELKIWRGNEYNERGEEQLADYLEAYHLQKGYLVSFNFNRKKKVGVKRVQVGDKVIIEAVV